MKPGKTGRPRCRPGLKHLKTRKFVSGISKDATRISGKHVKFTWTKRK